MNPFNDPGVRAEIESWGRDGKIRRAFRAGSVEPVVSGKPAQAA